MTETFETCGPQNSEDTANATSSPGSPGGVTPCNSPAGRQIGLFGQAVAPVNLSRTQAKGKGQPTSGTCGPSGSRSFASDILSASLASRLQARLATDGSMEYSMTWRRKATPVGRSYFQLAASARRTSGSGFGGWPTPRNADHKSCRNETANRSPDAKGWHKGMTLLDAATMAGWPTASSRDWKGCKSNQHGKNARPLNEVAYLAGWTTPCQDDTGNRKQRYAQGGYPLSLQASGATSTSSPAQTGKRGQLNPEHSRWLMGFPAAWLFGAPYSKPAPRFRKSTGTAG